MNILLNVTSSLECDAKSIVEELSQGINGDTYFKVTYYREDMLDEDIARYDMYITFVDDDSDILSGYDRLYNIAKRENKIKNFMVYFKIKEFYTNKAVYYKKKDINHLRLNRFMEYEATSEVVFDIMNHAALYFDADINVRNGVLRLKNYSVLELGDVRFIANNPKLGEIYSKIITAREEEKDLVRQATLDDAETLLSIERVHKYMEGIYAEYDRYLEYALILYREIQYSFTNDYVSTLDYIFTKEYFEIGHFTSISSCFNRGGYSDIVKKDNFNFDNIVSIMKMVAFSMAFADNNEFVAEILKKIFTTGKELELKEGKDAFFYYNAHNLIVKLGGMDKDLQCYRQYIELIESGVVEPNRNNAYRAYTIMGDYYLEHGEMENALPYVIKAEKYATSDRDHAMCEKTLFEIYRGLADSKHEKEYIIKASQHINLIDSGYHDDYASVIIAIMNTSLEFDVDNKWRNTVIDKALSCKYLDRECYYFLYLKKLFDMSNDIGDDERIEGLKYILGEMVEHFYIRPTTIYVGIYNALLILAGLYEKREDEHNAAECYKRAYNYLSILEDVDNDIDEQMAYVQFKLGDLAMDMESAKSYRQLSRADKRIYQYIDKTNKYVNFYDELLIKITERYIEDKRYRTATLIAKGGLVKLIDCCHHNEEYFKDVVTFCNHMNRTFKRVGMTKASSNFAMLEENYKKICAERNLELEESI